MAPHSSTLAWKIPWTEKPGSREFSSGPVVRTQHFTVKGVGSIPGWGPKILQATSMSKKHPKTQRGKDLIQDCCDETVEEGARVAGSRASGLSPVHSSLWVHLLFCPVLSPLLVR